MTITVRSLIWIGLLLAMFAWAGLGILVSSVPPAPGPLALFFAFVFLAVTGTALFFLALFRYTRGVDGAGASLRQGVLLGAVALVLAALQYVRLLTPVTGGAAFVLVLLLEILSRQIGRRSSVSSPPSSRGQTMAAHSSRGPRGRKRPRKTR